MDIHSKQASDAKPNRIRLAEGGGKVNPDQLAAGVAKTIEELSHLNWSTQKVSGLRSSGLEINFALMSGTVGKIVDLQPSWESLWTIADLANDELLLNKFRQKLVDDLIPNLTLRQIYPVALEMTSKNFEKAGYKLSKWETIIVAKMLTLILLFAKPPMLMEDIAGDYNIMPLLEEDSGMGDKSMPRWTNQFLNLVNREPRALKQPIKAIFYYCYEGLLYDAIMNGFQRIESVFGQPLGDAKEQATYRDELLADYTNGELSFSRVYLPLVIGGITVVDLVVLPDDNMKDAAFDISEMVEARRGREFNEDTAGLFDMVDRLMAIVLEKYGYRAKRI